jgi:hypothetical protein
MNIIGIDPGTSEGAFTVWDSVNSVLIEKAIMPNDLLLEWLKNQAYSIEIYCEMIASYGMAVGKEVFETCVWIGQAKQICQDHDWNFTPVLRQKVKLHHCHSSKAKDTNIRQALIDRFGAPGTAKNKGSLYGVSSHIWSALAITIYANDTMHKMSPVATTI